MKLLIAFPKDVSHSDFVSCIGWGTSTDLYSVGDDHVILKLNLKSDSVAEVAKLPKDVYCTDIHWYPVSGGPKKHAVPSELFVLGCTDGRFLIVSKLGRVENSVEAHKGALLGVRWGHDGTTLLTYGEDGAVKIWSRTGMLRSVLAQSNSPVYAGAWSPESDQVLYASSGVLHLKPLQPTVKPSQWRAHDGVVLAVDWSLATGLIVSGGEDRRYKVWDVFGRVLYTSLPHDCPVASVSWSPDGELFAAGGFNTLRLCDKAGWSYSLDKPNCGTVLRLAWSSDGTQVGGACGSGRVLIGRVVGRKLEWRHLQITLNEDNTIDVSNILSNSKEHLEFNEKVVRMSLRWGILIVTTASQCHVFRERNWTSPVTIDLKSSSVHLIKQAEKFFLMADSVAGLQLLSYEGRLISCIKYAGLLPDTLSPQTVDVSSDTVAIRDKRDPKVVRVFDTMTAKELGTGHHFQHKVEIETVLLSQAGSQQQRLLAFIDKNHDLCVVAPRDLSPSTTAITLGSMVSSAAWSDQCNMLVGIQDTRFVVWYHPAVAYVNKELLPLTRREKQFGVSKNPQIASFHGTHCVLRQSDGSLMAIRTSPFPLLLHKHVTAGNWDSAIKLCRLAKDPALSASLAGMAAGARELSTAIAAYSIIDEVDKVQHLMAIQRMQSGERKSAEMALFCHQPKVAESIYLQAGKIFRAIELHVQLFNWERALNLAVQHRTHVDTVLAFRHRYLEQTGQVETIKKFTQYTEKITIDWEKINAKIALENENP